jgi:nitrogenase-associated protein
MSELVFYEKPGCLGNARQKALLQRRGIWFMARDLSSRAWTVNSLRPFFGDLPVALWFNDSAPPVRSGELPIDRLDEMQALALMLRDPLLIRRPLLRLGRICQAGFGDGPVLAALGVRPDPGAALQACPARARSRPLCGDLR